MKRPKLTPELVVCALFLVIIFLFGIVTLVQRAGPILNSITSPFKYSNGIVKTYSELHDSFVEQVEEDSFTENLWNRRMFIDLYSIAQRVTLSVVNEDVSEYIVKDNHGLLHFLEPRTSQKNIQKYADKLIKLQDSIQAPILYVQAPNKKLEGYTVLPRFFDNYSNLNADDFLAAIDGKVDYLDLRKALEQDELDKENLFYVTDHHWTTPTAFWGFQRTVAQIRENYGLDLDPEGVYTDINNYASKLYKNCFLGAQGRRVGRFYAGLDDYTLLTPLFETSFTTRDTVASPDAPVSTGDFVSAFLDQDILNSKDVEANKHAAYLSLDRGELIIDNHLLPDGCKLLIVKDSFALPYACFMAPCAAQTTLIDVRYFPPRKTLSEYINQLSPDLVIFLYNTEVYSDIMFNFK